jgi:hypothetical protein
MNMPSSSPSVLQRFVAQELHPGAGPAPDLTVEHLPFTVRPVRNDGDFEKALKLRYAAYARHLPAFAQGLRAPEIDDTANGVVVLLAESKLDGEPLGTVRIQTNLDRPLNVEQSVDLPRWLKNQSVAEVRRLAVAPGNPGRMVKMILVKACMKYCVQNEIEWAVVAARPPLDRSYEHLLFNDILNGETFTPLPRDNNVLHRLLGLEIATIHAGLSKAKHPLLKFFCYTDHPDIVIGQPAAYSGDYMPSQANDTDRLAVR